MYAEHPVILRNAVTRATTAYVLGRLAWEIYMWRFQQDDMMPSPF